MSASTADVEDAEAATERHDRCTAASYGASHYTSTQIPSPGLQHRISSREAASIKEQKHLHANIRHITHWPFPGIGAVFDAEEARPATKDQIILE